MDPIVSIDNYLAMLLERLSPVTVLSAFFLCCARIFPIMVLAPFFGAKLLTGPVRIMFTIALCSIFLPQILFSLQKDIPFDINFTGYLMKEIFIGFILGFFVSIPFYIVQSSGSLIDHMRGSSSLQVTDPSTKTQTGPVGILYNSVLIVIFFSIGGPFLFIEAIQNSFVLVPINDVLNPLFFSPSIPFWKLAFSLIDKIFAIAIQLGAPALIGIVMADMFLGIANRLAPQVQIVFLGMSLKSWLGIALLAAAWIFILTQMGKESLIWLKTINKVIVQTASAPIFH